MIWRLSGDFLKRWWWYWGFILFICVVAGGFGEKGGTSSWILWFMGWISWAYSRDYTFAGGLRAHRMLPVSEKTLGRTVWLELALFPSASITGGFALGAMLFREDGAALGRLIWDSWSFGSAAAVLCGGWSLMVSMAPLGGKSPTSRSVVSRLQSLVPLLGTIAFFSAVLIVLFLSTRPFARWLLGCAGPFLLVLSWATSQWFLTSRLATAKWRQTLKKGEKSGPARQSFLEALFTDTRPTGDVLGEAEAEPGGEAAKGFSMLDRLMSNPYGAIVYVVGMPVAVFGGFALVVGILNGQAFGPLLSFALSPLTFMLATLWIAIFLVMAWLPGLRVAAVLPMSRTRLIVAILGVLVAALAPLVACWGAIPTLGALPAGPVSGGHRFVLLQFLSLSLGLAAAPAFAMALALRWNAWAGGFGAMLCAVLIFPGGEIADMSFGKPSAGAVFSGLVLVGSVLAIHLLLRRSGEPFRRKSNPFSSWEEAR